MPATPARPKYARVVYGRVVRVAADAVGLQIYVSTDANSVRAIHTAVQADVCGQPANARAAQGITDVVLFVAPRGVPGDSLYIIRGSQIVGPGLDGEWYPERATLRAVGAEIACGRLRRNYDSSVERDLRYRLSRDDERMRRKFEESKRLRDPWDYRSD